jgi:hypothetical protein
VALQTYSRLCDKTAQKNLKGQGREETKKKKELKACKNNLPYI